MDTYLLIKYLRCATTPEEEAAVRRWLADDPDESHARQYSDLHFIYEGMLMHGGDDAALSRENGSGHGRRHLLRRIAVAAASAAAVVLVAAGAALWSRNAAVDRLAENSVRTVYVPPGKSMQLTLEDGTRLWLNSGTEIEIPAVFARKTRDVRLIRGEALFDVAQDRRRPFNVDTYASSISVLGTRFNVDVDEESGAFSAALLRGSIKVVNKCREGEEYVLETNQMVTMEDGHLHLEHIGDPGSVDCWTDGLIDIAGVPFGHLMRKFELAYDVNIDIQRDTLPEIRYTRGKVRVSDGILHAMSMLALVCDIGYEYDRQTNTIVIR